jgi:transcriptional regulator with XRE-family HTH domain
MTTAAKEIGNRVRLLREELRMSQDELATRLGYKSRSSINKIELGQRNLTQSKIKALADALDTTPAYIMGWTDPLGVVDPDQLAEIIMTDAVMTAHIQTLNGLTQDHRCQVYDLIDLLHNREDGVSS